MPVDQLAKISRYVGADGNAPDALQARAARAGTRSRPARAGPRRSSPASCSTSTRSASAAAATPSSPTRDWLREFEAAFPYRETPDQREAIESVKADMESERPMDRLICGDVGYGKTEVALRAAFKAANAGKQVLMLAPTTILAQQHFGTFSERLRDYPFTVEQVSRFRPAAEQREVVKRFAEGKVDILIGTHRVLSRDVRAKDLGLIIVDEEQRFGVKQKELLRQLKLKVDVISMSATPIPRTLQMCLAGLRDITVIETPPEGRRPVKTYVGEYDEELVKQALMRERERGGQAFFLHNRVEDIDETAERLRALCPDMRFTVAHGQMDEKQLEERMLGFLRGDADVLVSTSIIESGIDIPQANTLIVDRADLFGLSQLYQIRGRVGRSRERAYAYLLYPSAAALTPEAADRLSALSDYTELGAGFKVAMRDLELRGAGSLLGDEQSGHVAALGFELYMQMLDEAVRAADEDETELDFEPVRLDVNVDAYVPADYIPYEQAKVDVHRRIAGARDVGELEELRAELGRPLRRSARAAREPDHAPAGAHQARRGGRPRRVLPPGPARRDADRARLRAGEEDPRGDPRRALRVGQVAALRAGPRRPGQALPGRGAGRGRAARRAARSRMRPASRCFNSALEPRPLPCLAIMRLLRYHPGAVRLFCAGCDRRRVWRRGGSPGNAVAEVDGTAIERADYDHWLNVAAQVERCSRTPPCPSRRTSRSASPQPKKTQPKPAEGQPKLTDQQLKDQCKQQYEQLRDQVLSCHLVRVDRARGRRPGRQGHATPRSTSPSRSRRSSRSRRPPTTRSSSRTRARPRRTCACASASTCSPTRSATRSPRARTRSPTSRSPTTTTRTRSASRSPSGATCSIVLTKTEAKANEAKQALEGGESLKSVAKKYSIDQASKAQGGKLPAVAKGQQEKAFDDAVFSAKKGELDGPGQDAVRLVRLRGRQDHARPRSRRCEQAKETIKQLLASQNQQKALDKFVKDFQKKWKDKTDCREGFVTQDCKNAPKATPTPHARARSQPAPTAQPEQPEAAGVDAGEHRSERRGRGARAPRRAHAAAARRVPVGPRAGRALDRPAHGRGGLRARRTPRTAATTPSCSTSSATSSSRSTSCRCCSRSAARGAGRGRRARAARS